MDKSKRYKIILSIITLIFLSVAIANFILVTFVHRLSTDECLWTAEKGKEGMLISNIVPGGVADKAGIKEGDILLKIDGKSFKSPHKAQRYINQLQQNQIARYTIQRGDKIFEVNVLIKKHTNRVSLVMSIVGFVFLIVGYVVIISNPLQYSTRIYFYFSFVFFLVLLFNSISAMAGVFTYIAIAIQRISVVLWGPAVLHFFMTFSKRPSILSKHPRLIYLFYLPSIVVFTYVIFINPAWQYLMNIVVAGYFSVAIYFSSVSCRQIKDEKQRKPLRIVAWGSTLGLIPLGILVFLPDFLTKLIGITEVVVLLSMMVLVPISFGYAIMRYGLMDIGIIIKKSLIYSLVTGIFIVLYIVLVVGLGGVLARKMGVQSQIVNLLFIGIVALAFNPAKERVQRFVDAKFYRQRYNYQKALLELSQELPTLINLDEILAKVLSTLKETLHIEKIAINVLEEGKKIFRTYSQTGIPVGCNCDFMENPAGLTGLIARQKCCQTFYRIDEDMELQKIASEDLEKIKRAGLVLTIPMFYRQRLTGLIHLGPKLSDEIYSQEDMDLLTTVAGQTAIAIANARLHLEELRRQKLENELKLARRIQQDLLPKTDPKIPGLEVVGRSIPATEVGGDYFDYVQRHNRQLLVFVGDVSGKGMPAALYMSKVQGMIQIASSLFQTPKEILIEVNRKIYEGIERKSFITMLTVLFDLERRQAIVCRAGHNPIFLKKSKQNQIELIQSRGIGLGLEKGEIFKRQIEEVTFPLIPGDYFILYSDGLTEAMNANRELFGEDRVREIISSNNYSSATELQDILLTQVEKFRNGAEQNDDITIVTVRID